MIEGIDAIVYSTDGTAKNWDDTRRFFADWGLQPVTDNASTQVWETLNGAQVIVKLPTDASLPQAIEAGPTLREVVWGVKSSSDLICISKVNYFQRNTPLICYIKDNKNSVNLINSVSYYDPHGLLNTFRLSQKPPSGSGR